MESDAPRQLQNRRQAPADIRGILHAQRFAVLSTHAEGKP